MACACEQKKAMSDLARVSGLARKAAILDQCIMVVYKKQDGIYHFDRLGSVISGEIIEYRHFL